MYSIDVLLYLTQFPGTFVHLSCRSITVVIGLLP